MRIAVLSAFLLSGCDSAISNFDPKPGAEFRHFAREVMGNIDPVCPMSERPEMLDKYAPMRERLEQLKSKIVGTRLATDLAVAEADEAFFRSITLVECAEPDGPESERYLMNVIKSMSGHLEKMEAIAQKGGA
ncbi:hypothetical protein ACPVPU_14265 [Sphingomonas sp. CJ99]